MTQHLNTVVRSVCPLFAAVTAVSLAFADGPAASAGAAAAAGANASTSTVARVSKPAAPAKCVITAEIRGPAGNTQFRCGADSVELVAVDGDTTECFNESAEVTVKPGKYRLRSKEEGYKLTPEEIDVTGKAEADFVITFVAVESEEES